MRILFVLHQFFPLHVTGTEQYARALALTLRSAGHEVEVFAFEPLVQYAADGAMSFRRIDDIDGIPVHRFGLHPVTAPNRELAETENPLVGEIYRDLLDDASFDLVHVFHPRHMGEAAIAGPAERGIPVVVNLMDFWFLCPNFILLQRDGSLCEGPPEGGWGCVRCLDPELHESLEALGLSESVRRIADLSSSRGQQAASPVRRAKALLGRKERMLSYLRRADLAIAPSEFLRQKFIEHGHPAAHLRRLAYGLDPDRFAGAPAKKPEPASPVLDIGYVGSITHHKGVHVLLDAVAALPDAPLAVHIYGDPRSQPGYSDRLIEETVDPRVTFHGRFDPEQLGQVLAGLDLLAVPSLWYENTPFSVLEALWFGLPVFASDLGGISEIVHDGTNGRVFAAGDAAALARCLQDALDHPESLAVAPDAKPASIAQNVEELVSIYRELIPADAAETES